MLAIAHSPHSKDSQYIFSLVIHEYDCIYKETLKVCSLFINKQQVFKFTFIIEL